MQIPERVLKFKVGGELFGIDSEVVDKILEVPSITPVPLADKKVLGVCVLFGKIVTVVDAGLVLVSKRVNLSSKESRVITIWHNDEISAICVDEVVVISDVVKENFEPNKENGGMIEGFLKDEDDVAQIVNPEAIFEGISMIEFSPIGVSVINDDISKSGRHSENEDNVGKFLFFKVREEEYGLDVDIVKEIVFPQDDIIPIAGSDALGMMKLRDKVLAIVDLREKLGFEGKSLDSKSRCVIVEQRGRSIGLVVDEVEEVKDVVFSRIEKVAEEFQSEFIEGIYRENERVVSILSLRFVDELIKKYYIQEENATSTNVKIEDESMSEIVVFGIGKEEYAFDVDDVQEIIKYTQLTPIPDAPEFVEGILNLRGAVIPVVSLSNRLGFEQKITDKTKIIVCTINGEKLGFIVDEVNEVLFVEDKYISNAKSEDAIFSQVITLDGNKRVILKLKPKQLFDEEFFNKISTIGE